MIEFKPTLKQHLAWKLLQDNITSHILYGGSVGSGKALTIDTKIPTPNGFVDMSNLKVGDKVFDKNGKPINIIGITPIMLNHKVYEIKFDDHEKVKCDAGHLWTVEFNGKILTCDTEYIFNTYNKLRKNHYKIPLSKKVNYKTKKLNIDPYLLGVWLGDGSSNTTNITSADNQIIDILKLKGYSYKYKKKYQYTLYEGLDRDEKGRFFCKEGSLKDYLRKYNLLKNKHIPTDFLFNSINNRIELLKGLMDTDGSCSKKGACLFYNTNKNLIDDVKTLICSLGIKVNLNSKTAMLYGKDCGLVYTLTFKADFPVFNLDRKRIRQNFILKYTNSRYIKNVKLLSTEPVKCIEVDSEDRLYLCGDAYIPTHNSYLGCMWVFLSCIQYPNTRYLIGRSRLNVLKRTTLKTLQDIIKQNKLQDKVIHNSQNNTLHFWNGSEIIFIDLFPYPADPDYDRLGSLEITGAFIDELSEISFRGFEVLYTRIRYKLNEYNITPKLFCASNPANGWSKNFFYKPFQEKNEKEYIRFIQALPTDNQYLPQSYLEGLSKTLTSGLKQRLLYGSWDFDSDDYALFQYEKLQQSFYNDYFNNTDTESYLTCDIADLGGDRTVLSYWKGWSLISMKILKQNDTVQVVSEIKKIMNEFHIPINRIIIDSVGVGAGVASLLKGCVRYSGGERTINGEKFKNIKTQLMYKFADKINSGEVNFNMPYDDTIIQEALLYKKEFKGEMAYITSKDEVKQRLGKSPDIIDSLYLRAYWEVKKKNNTGFTVI